MKRPKKKSTIYIGIELIVMKKERNKAVPAAYLILKKDNEKDLEDIPKEIHRDMKLKFVKTVDEVLKLALKNGHQMK